MTKRIYALDNLRTLMIFFVVVIGILALLMLPWSLPAFVKFLILAVLSFALSNLLVSAYRWIKGKVGDQLRIRMKCWGIVRCVSKDLRRAKH